MTIKSFLLGSAAALVAVTGARAADAVVVAEPEAVEYVRVCDAYGKGFFYIPGTETCLKVSGYVRNTLQGGDDAYKGVKRGEWDDGSRADLRFDARSDTELGTLKSYAELRFNYRNGANAETVDLNEATISLGGFLAGIADSQFTSWTDYLGDIISDDVVANGSYSTNQISYTFAGGNGFSATLGLEQGAGDFAIGDYTPHIVAGAKIAQGWGSVSVVGGYDSVIEEWAGKVRLDVKITDAVKAFVMGGYQSNFDDNYTTGHTRSLNWFGRWEGDWAVWGGLSAKVSDKATVNAQVAYESEGTVAGTLNVAYELVPGFTITPEISYTKFDGHRKDQSILNGGNDDAFGGMIRFQRNF